VFKRCYSLYQSNGYGYIWYSKENSDIFSHHQEFVFLTIFDARLAKFESKKVIMKTLYISASNGSKKSIIRKNSAKFVRITVMYTVHHSDINSDRGVSVPQIKSITNSIKTLQDSQ
jgi:hypothetical protein